jgi:hypothetical protein
VSELGTLLSDTGWTCTGIARGAAAGGGAFVHPAISTTSSPERANTGRGPALQELSKKRTACLLKIVQTDVRNPCDQNSKWPPNQNTAVSSVTFWMIRVCLAMRKRL